MDCQRVIPRLGGNLARHCEAVGTGAEYGALLVFPFVLSGWLISLCLHEFGHAVAAYAGGDTSVADRGYLTLDPIRYTEAQYSVLWPVVMLALGGIGLPGGAVYINMQAIQSPVNRMLMSAAGPLATLAVLIALLALIPESPTPAYLPFYAALTFLAFLQLTSLVFNLLPVPGFDGWGVIEPWLPADIQEFGAQIAGIAPLILFTLFLTVQPLRAAFWDQVFYLADMIDLDLRGLGLGIRLFQFWR
jgi:Zn-dependent protease